jgi:hypothetical protein
VTITLHFADNVLDLVEKDIDLALRLGPAGRLDPESAFAAASYMHARTRHLAPGPFWSKASRYRYACRGTGLPATPSPFAIGRSQAAAS